MKNLRLLLLVVFIISCGKQEITVPPAIVTGVFVSKITPTAVTLEWPAVKGADGYRVYRINYLTDILRVNVPVFEDINLKNQTGYSYQVCAYNKNGEGPKSIVINVYTSSPQRYKNQGARK